MLWAEIRTVLVLFILILVPGWAMLAVTDYWRKWEALQRWFLAASLGIAFWPVLYYALRVVMPALRLGTNKLVLLLVLFAALITWKLRKDWKVQFSLGQWGWVILGILAATLYTRLILAHRFPYPAWTDSLHHTLITELTALTGQLPKTLEPYANIPLTMYHLGLYALTAPVQLLAKVPSHTALLWTAQFLNGLCGIGVFLVLDKKVSRLAAAVGLLVVGLWSFMPAWYFNWGRFTQLAAQVVLLTGALLVWEALQAWKEAGFRGGSDVWTPTVLATLSLAATGMLHFRVAGYLLPLIFLVCGVSLLGRKGKNERLRALCGIVAIGLLAFVLLAPAMVPALSIYLRPPESGIAPTGAADGTAETQDQDIATLDYFDKFTFKTLYGIGVQKWIFILAVAGFVISLLVKRMRWGVVLVGLWVVLLIGEGFLYKLNIATLAFSNMTAIMLAAYLPAGLFIGCLAESLDHFSSKLISYSPAVPLLWLAIILGYVGAFARVSGLEPSRQFMSGADETAMNWIIKNTPSDALFAVNTYDWMGTHPHGSDAGFWIPYFTQRQTTAGVMISDLGPDFDEMVTVSKEVTALYSSPGELAALCPQGVDYLYSGKTNPYGGKDFDMAKLDELPGTTLVFDQDGVQILQVCH